jgi:glutathionylspermidine synthase
MQRRTLPPRLDWRERVDAVGLTYHSHEDGPYWDESACYELTAEEVACLEKAGNELHRLCVQAAEAVIENSWWNRLAIPEAAHPAILRSWERNDFSLYGRFDLAYAPATSAPPKLLEYNADTPTALVEASVAQWFWLQERVPQADQFNSIHERLIDAWRRWAGSTIHFSSVQDHPEDEQTVLYLRDTCEQAGVRTRGIAVEEIGWDSRHQVFVDLDLEPIGCCFKLYPWEWMWAEEFAGVLPHSATHFIEPAWKMLLSNKGLLPILWELFPEHPNLLPAYDDSAPLGGSYVRKPRLSREGSNVLWMEKGTVLEATDGDYGAEGHVYQAVAPQPEFDGHRPIFGVWMVDHEAAGLGIREDTRRITGNLSRFVPHYFHA